MKKEIAIVLIVAFIVLILLILLVPEPVNYSVDIGEGIGVIAK